MNPLRSAPWRLQIYEDVASTQDIAIAAASAGEVGGLAVLARSQNAARGSRGRAWAAPYGNLHLSILIRTAEEKVSPGYWSLLAGLALYDALSSYAPGLMLKWPNDVLLDGVKLAGVLINTSIAVSGDLDWVVIGLGANLAVAPHVAGRQTACLPAPPPQPEEVARSVLAALDRWWGSALAPAWLARAHPAGTEIEASTPGGWIKGRFAGLSASGELRLEGQIEPLRSAEIFLAGRVQVAEPASIPGPHQSVSCCSL